MSFPACPHKKNSRPIQTLRWLGGEPYRLFFLSGILFSIAGVVLWPMFYSGHLGFYPGSSHARIMIQAFGGAFVLGFLGTAGPRMLSAPRLLPAELVILFLLHLANGICHLYAQNVLGDRLFLLLLLGFVLSLAARVMFFRKDWPPPAMLLVATGLLCGISGTVLWLNPAWIADAPLYRLAGLLLYQGFLLGPIMGVGIFLFPRLLGGDFGQSQQGLRPAFLQMTIAAIALLSSFAVDVWINPAAGQLMRAGAFVFALSRVHWRSATSSPGTLANALRICCLPLAFLGLLAPAFLILRHTALDHLLFIGGFGLLCLIVGARVLFGHSGDLANFAKRSWIARGIVFTIVLAALTRASADFIPLATISHYKYAAWSWATAALIWTAWQAPRFFKRDPED